MKHLLRRFKDEDSKGVRDLILNILAKEYPFDRTAYSDSDLDNIGEVYGGKHDAFFVIEEAGEIAGTIGVKEETREDALLRRFFVDLKHRKRGYGTELLDKAIAFCKEKDYHHVTFRCTDRMGAAIKLCEKKGFKETEKLEVSGFKIHKLELEI